MMVDLSECYFETLTETYREVYKSEEKDEITELYNYIYKRNDTEYLDLHRESILQVLEAEILKRIRDMRTDKQGIDKMIIRKADLNKKIVKIDSNEEASK